MDISLWSLLTLVGRFILYACVASAIGGVFSSVLLARHREVAQAITRYTGYGCLAGIVVAIYSLFSQVGAMVDRGFVGIFDINMTGNGTGWGSLADWERDIVPAIVAATPRANGKWHITHGVEVDPFRNDDHDPL